MRIEVVPASCEDMRAAAAFEHEWIYTTEWMPKRYSLSEMQQRYTETFFKAHACFAARLAGELLGVIAYKPTCHFIDLLYVKSDKRGRGVGSLLLKHALRALSPRAQVWTFQANLKTHRFYKRHGFLEICSTDGAGNDEHLPDLLMEWRAA